MRKITTALMLVLAMAATAFAQDAKAKAEAILKQARAAIGDESKFKSLQGLSAEGTVRQTFGERQTESELLIEIMMPDKLKKTTTSQFATVTNAINGDQIWNDFVPGMGMGGGGAMVFRGGGPGGPGGPGGQGGSNPAMASYMQMQQRRELTQVMLSWLLMAPPSSQMQFAYVGEAPGPNGKADVIEAKGADGMTARLYFDQESHRLIGLIYKAKQMRFGGRGPGGPGGPGGQGAQGGQRQPQGQPQAGGQANPQGGGQGQRPELTPEERERRMKEFQERFEKAPEIDYRWAFDDYKSVGGLNLPHRLTKIEAGTANEEWEISKIKINPKLTPDKFVKKEKDKASN